MVAAYLVQLLFKVVVDSIDLSGSRGQLCIVLIVDGSLILAILFSLESVGDCMVVQVDIRILFFRSLPIVVPILHCLIYVVMALCLLFSDGSAVIHILLQVHYLPWILLDLHQ